MVPKCIHKGVCHGGELADITTRRRSIGNLTTLLQANLEQKILVPASEELVESSNWWFQSYTTVFVEWTQALLPTVAAHLQLRVS